MSQLLHVTDEDGIQLYFDLDQAYRFEVDNEESQVDVYFPDDSYTFTKEEDGKTYQIILGFIEHKLFNYNPYSQPHVTAAPLS